MSKPRSRYDDLHDRYYNLLSTKSGTRYERLAAVVFKCLDESGTVIHDLKLVGDSSVPHQIDVTIERDGRQKRTLLECKDFDLSGEKVGLDIVRNFYGVVNDLQPDEAYIVTCNGFTKDAQTYAEHYKIELFILRELQETDWARRIRKIIINLISVFPSEPQIFLGVKSDEDIQKIANDLEFAGVKLSTLHHSESVFFNTPEGRFQACDFIQQNMNYSARTLPGKIEHNIDVSNVTLEVSNLGAVPLEELKISYEILHGKQTVDIKGDQIAKLLLQRMGEQKDRVICVRDLHRFQVNNITKEVN